MTTRALVLAVLVSACDKEAERPPPPPVATVADAAPAVAAEAAPAAVEPTVEIRIAADGTVRVGGAPVPLEQLGAGGTPDRTKIVYAMAADAVPASTPQLIVDPAAPGERVVDVIARVGGRIALPGGTSIAFPAGTAGDPGAEGLDVYVGAKVASREALAAPEVRVLVTTEAKADDVIAVLDKAVGGGAARIGVRATGQGMPKARSAPKQDRPPPGGFRLGAVKGSGIDTGAVRRQLQTHLAGMKACFEKRRAEDPEIGGTMTVELTINAKGVATSVSNRGVDDAVGECIADVIGRARYPQPASANEVTVKTSITMRP